LPITIKQILNSTQDVPDDSVKIDGREASQITFVAQITKVNAGSTFVGYVMDDGTGQINVNFWIEQVVFVLRYVLYSTCQPLTR
jgi:replication factor A2